MLNVGGGHVGDLSTPSKSDTLMLHPMPGLAGDECVSREIDLLLGDSSSCSRPVAFRALCVPNDVPAAHAL